MTGPDEPVSTPEPSDTPADRTREASGDDRPATPEPLAELLRRHVELRAEITDHLKRLGHA
ncbi:hypothetical protein GL263_19630 [Streptomyces durbertensis]|uniref:Uncharacterized protein n=1 Tax=Streptomyces durbertensis TaxID=2448886 RepID=A0ABR6EK79_9ACTN|nr:hypothetical protein [Streptomyces durbertensis]MBB1245751.1 hypothetical protein [Streptomyces durbertensis]